MESQGYAQAQLGSRRIGAGDIYTRCDARLGDDRRIVSGVGGDGEEVLGGDIHAEALQQPFVPKAETVAQGQIVQLEVVAFLKEVGGDDTAAALHVLVIEIGTAKHIVRTAELKSHAILAHIEDLETESAVHRETEIPVLVAERVVPREKVGRSAIADIAFVGSVDVGGEHLLVVLVVYEHIAVLVVAGILIASELAYLATFLHTEEILVGADAGLLIEVDV